MPPYRILADVDFQPVTLRPSAKTAAPNASQEAFLVNQFQDELKRLEIGIETGPTAADFVSWIPGFSNWGIQL